MWLPPCPGSLCSVLLLFTTLLAYFRPIDCLLTIALSVDFGHFYLLSVTIICSTPGGGTHTALFNMH